MIIHTPARRFGGALAVLSVVAVLAACAPASSTDDASPVSESADSTEDTSGTDAQPGERIEYTGASEAHVVFDAAPMRFAGDGTADGGWCVQRTNGMLDVELHLVEIDGKPFSGDGANPELFLELPITATDDPGGIHLIAGGGWIAGDTVANVLDRETPEITLVAEGATVRGTQLMVSTTAGGSSEVEVEFEVECR